MEHVWDNSVDSFSNSIRAVSYTHLDVYKRQAGRYHADRAQGLHQKSEEKRLSQSASDYRGADLFTE